MTFPPLPEWRADDNAAVVRELQSHNTPQAFHGLARVAAALFETPVVLISIIDEACDRQVFASQLGVPSPWAERGETPLSHSVCQHVKSSGAPLVVTDARTHPLLRDSLAIQDLGVVAYLGMPVHDPSGNALGAICIIDGKPREWTTRDQDLLGDLAICVSDEIKLRAYALRQEAMHRRLQVAHDRLRRYTAMSEAVAQPALAPGLDLPARLKEVLRNAVRAFGYETGHLAVIDPDDPDQLRILTRVCPAGIRAADTVVRLENTLAKQVLTAGCSLTRDASQGEETRRELSGAPVRDYAAVPLLGSQGEAIGVIELTGPSLRATPLDESDKTVLGIASMFAATLIEFGVQGAPSGDPVHADSPRETAKLAV